MEEKNDEKEIVLYFNANNFSTKQFNNDHNIRSC